MAFAFPFGRKAAVAALAAFTLAAASFAGSKAAEARYRHGGPGPALALGIIGLAAGAIAAGAAAEARAGYVGGYDAYDEPVYAPAPVYRAPRYYGRPDYHQAPYGYYAPRYRYDGHPGWQGHRPHHWEGRGWRHRQHVLNSPYRGTH
jgi:hypothetical protein